MSQSAQPIPSSDAQPAAAKTGPQAVSPREKRPVLACEMGHLLSGLRRVQVPINKDGANITFIAGDAHTARIVATSGPHLSCSTPLGMALPSSFVVRGSTLLKTLGSYGPENLESRLEMEVISRDKVDSYCEVKVQGKSGRYKGTMALAPDTLELSHEAIARERECRAEGHMVQASQKHFFAGMRRAIQCAKNKANNQNYSNVFFESDGKRLWAIGVSNTYASRICIAEKTKLREGTWSIHASQADIVVQGIDDQVIDENSPVELAFSGSQLLVSIGHVTYALRCTQGQLPALGRIIAPFQATWSVTLGKEEIKQIQHLLPIMAGEDGSRQGLRFTCDGDGVYAVPEGKNAMDAQVPLPGAVMTGAMPTTIFLATDILGCALRADSDVENVHLNGSDAGNHPVHVTSEGVEGLMVIMPTNV